MYVYLVSSRRRPLIQTSVSVKHVDWQIVSDVCNSIIIEYNVLYPAWRVYFKVYIHLYIALRHARTHLLHIFDVSK